MNFSVKMSILLLISNLPAHREYTTDWGVSLNLEQWKHEFVNFAVNFKINCTYWVYHSLRGILKINDWKLKFQQSVELVGQRRANFNGLSIFATVSFLTAHIDNELCSKFVYFAVKFNFNCTQRLGAAIWVVLCVILKRWYLLNWVLAIFNRSWKLTTVSFLTVHVESEIWKVNFVLTITFLILPKHYTWP